MDQVSGKVRCVKKVNEGFIRLSCKSSAGTDPEAKTFTNMAWMMWMSNINCHKNRDR